MMGSGTTAPAPLDRRTEGQTDYFINPDWRFQQGNLHLSTNAEVQNFFGPGPGGETSFI